MNTNTGIYFIRQMIFFSSPRRARIFLIVFTLVTLSYRQNQTVFPPSSFNWRDSNTVVENNRWESFPSRSLKQILFEPTVPLESLWLLYDTISINKRSPAFSFREISYVTSRQASVSYNDITLVTQVSVDKLFRLVEQLERWNGPISCAVYLPSITSIQELFLYVQKQNQIFHSMVTLHVMLENVRGRSSAAYPINRLRNLDLDNIDTEFFFYADVDFMPSNNMHDYLKDFFTGNKNSLRFSTLYVVPAFEFVGRSGDNVLLGSKEQLLEMAFSGKVVGFHTEHFAPGHNNTNFNLWLSCDSNKTYSIKYQYMFEPYVAGSRHSLHRFDDRFRGYGVNKWSWIAEAHFRGYGFEVLCEVFLIHMNHAHDLKQRRESITVQELQHWYEKTYWHSRYNVNTKLFNQNEGASS